MSEVEIKNAIIEELDNLGIIIDVTEEDIDLLSIEMDSITFISFIVSLEERFEIQFPDESLTMEVMKSLNGLTNLLHNFLNNQ